MADNQIRDRYQALFAGDFMPLIRNEQAQGAPERLAYAEEFSAANGNAAKAASAGASASGAPSTAASVSAVSADSPEKLS